MPDKKVIIKISDLEAEHFKNLKCLEEGAALVLEDLGRKKRLYWGAIYKRYGKQFAKAECTTCKVDHDKKQIEIG